MGAKVSSDHFWTKKGQVVYRLVEICKVFHKKKKHVKCNEFGPVSMKIIRFAWNSSVEPEEGYPYIG